MARKILTARPRHSTVVAYLALSVALGGTSTALAGAGPRLGLVTAKKHAAAYLERGCEPYADCDRSSVGACERRARRIVECAGLTLYVDGALCSKTVRVKLNRARKLSATAYGSRCASTPE